MSEGERVTDKARDRSCTVFRHEASPADFLPQARGLALSWQAPHSQASLSSPRQMTLSYFTATTTAVATAVGMNMLTKVWSGAAAAWWPRGGSRVLGKTAFPQGQFPRLVELGMARALLAK